MDSATAEIVQAIGNDLLRGSVAVVVETFFLAIYSIFMYLASRILIHKGFKRAPVVTLVVLITMYAMALAMWGFDVTNLAREIQVTLINDPGAPMADKYAVAAHDTFSLVAPLDAMYSFMSNLGDGIIIWRVYALWCQTHRSWLVMIPLSLLVGSVVSSFLLTYCVAHLGTQIVDGAFQSPAFCKNAQTASYSMATVTTAVSTFLIALKTWEYRWSVKPIVSNVSGRVTRVERFMILLIESGVLYFLFFLVQVIGSNIPEVKSNPRLSFPFFVYSYSTSVVVGLYPTIIIILAHSDHAVLDAAVSSTFLPSNNSNFQGVLPSSGKGIRQTSDIALSAFSTSTHHTHSPHAQEGKPVLSL